MKKFILLISALLLLCLYSYSQTGPGGVGNSSSNAVWFDASKMSLNNNDLVPSLLDFSGNIRNGSQATGIRRARFLTNQINGLPAFNFDGNDFYTTGSIAALNTNTISYFIVARTSTTSENQDLISANFSSTNTAYSDRLWGAQISSSTGTYRTFNRSSTGANIINLGYQAGFQFISSVWNGTTEFNGYRNGSSFGNLTNVNSNPIGNNWLRIGASSSTNLNFYYRGDISEIIVYNTNLNITQRLIVENYISSKYNRLIPTDLYAFDTPGGHGFEVAGIGQTSITDNHTNARGTGIVQISTPSDLNNNEFLLWGHDNAALTINTSNVPTGFIGGERLNRTWRAGHTGNLGTVTVSFDLTGISFNSSSLAVYIDNDGNFTDAIAHTTGFVYDANTNTATFTGVPLSNGNYFTIGTAGPIISVQDGNWLNPNTWNCTCIPTTIDAVIIMPGHTVTVDPNGVAEDLTINGTLNFGANGVLSIYRNIANNGLIGFSNGTIVFTGTVSQSFTATQLTRLRNITVNNANGLAISSGTYELYGSLEILAGNLDNSANNSFTLVSNIAGDARIGAIPAASSILGNFIVQRYVAAGLTGYRFLTSTVSGRTLADWNDDFEMRGFPGIFSGTVSGNPSMYYYVEALSTPNDAAGFRVPANISHPLNHGEAWWAYMGTGQTNTAPINIDVTGPLYTGTRNISHITYTDHAPVGPDAHDGWNLVGNPFVSTIDWNSLNRTNLYNRIQIWNPATGSFGVYDGVAGTSTNGVTNLIASSQGFNVQAFATPTLSIPENSKSVINKTFVRTALTDANAFKLNLSNNMDIYSDEIVVRFNPKASLKYDENDILKLAVPDNSASFIATRSDNVLLAFNTLPEAQEEYFIPVVVKAGSAARYTIGFENINAIANNYNVYLKDLNNEVKLDISKDLTYSFNITDPSSEKNLVLHLVSKGHGSEVTLTTDEVRKNNEQVNVFSSQNVLNVNFDLNTQSDATITVYSLLGQQLFTQVIKNAHKNSVQLNSNLIEGVYIISVETKDLKIARKINF
ncbi:MAG: T9SS type A sorting domain-containing protein [Bacteroidetes bacterium]|nr:T9SS type A sorting domain-containing protein [Bacteroidota bacterium]HET6244702.1 T9SS type A sorting domain-containing protein [Bacteroidia bacterium]